MENITKKIYGSYYKFKKRVYHNTQLLIYKEDIVNFEIHDFEDKINQLILFAENNFSDDEYIKLLFEKITYIPVIKKTDNEKTDLNYFIRMPVELHILDTLWTILVHKNLNEDLYNDKFVYGNLIDRNFHYKDYDTANVDWSNTNLFKKYVQGYNKWIQNSVKKIEEIITLKSEIALVSCDLKRYYYSVSNPFNEVEKHIDRNQYKKLIALTSVINQIYCRYNGILKEIASFDELNDYVLPIGLASSMLISNIYLHDFDKYIYNEDNVEFYGRYVDDIIIIFNNVVDKDGTIGKYNSILTTLYPKSKLKFGSEKTKIFTYTENNQLEEIDRLLLYFQHKKDKYYMQDDLEELTFSKYIDFEKKQLRNNMLIKGTHKEKDFLNLPLMDVILIMNYIYTYVKFDSDTINHTFDRMKKEIRINHKYHIWKEFFRWIANFGKDNNRNSWIEEIKSIISEKYYNYSNKINDVKKDTEIRTKIIKSYLEYSEIALILSNIKTNSKRYNHYKKCGMIPNLSLIRYLIENLSSQKLYNDIPHHKKILENNMGFSHLWEVSMFDSIVNVLYSKKKSISSTVKTFTTLNNIDYEDFYYIKNSYQKTDKTYGSNKINIYDNEMKNKFIVSHPNIDLEQSENILSSWDERPTYEDTREFIINLLETLENETTLLVLPELYVYYEWLYILGQFSHTYQISMSLGLKNRVIKDINKNILLSIYPFRDKFSRRYAIVLGREKNFYSPEEILWAKKSGFDCKDPKVPYYFLVNKNRINFADYLCYEITDIHSRALFKNYVNIIMIPMLNRDTDYFNNIIFSLSRDLSCCVITANSASWGNSSIILPKNSYNKVLTEFKGGFNQYLVSTEVPIYDLIEHNEDSTVSGKYFKKHPANFDYYNKIKTIEFE